MITKISYSFILWISIICCHDENRFWKWWFKSISWKYEVRWKEVRGMGDVFLKNMSGDDQLCGANGGARTNMVARCTHLRLARRTATNLFRFKVRVHEIFEIWNLSSIMRVLTVRVWWFGVILKNGRWPDKRRILVVTHGEVGNSKSKLADTATSAKFTEVYWNCKLSTLHSSYQQRVSFVVHE